MGKNDRSSRLGQVSLRLKDLQSYKGLAFKEVFNGDRVTQLVNQHVPEFRDRVFSPLTTLLGFLAQVLSSDRSCRSAVAQINADRIARGLKPASANTGAYCKARDRLPEKLIHDLVCETADEMEKSVPLSWRWKGRSIKVVDGTVLSVADSPENQAEFQRGFNPEEQTGFPLTRLVTVFSLATGCVLDVASGPYRGKGTGERSLFRQLLHCFSERDIIIGDAFYRLYDVFWLVLRMKGDAIFSQNKALFMDYSVIKRIKKNDKIILWKKPSQPPEWMGKVFYQILPETITLRMVTITINKPGFRSKQVTLFTTLLDPKLASQEEIGMLYRTRWHAELNLRSLKCVLKMESLASKTPQMVRKEIFTCLLAYNLVRRLMGQAAFKYELQPIQISFKGTVQILNQYRPLWQYCSSIHPQGILIAMLEAIARHRVGDRPDRVEPRRTRRFRSRYGPLNKPRSQFRVELLA